MFFYKSIPAGQESCTRYATNSTLSEQEIRYQFNPSFDTKLNLHATLDRVLFLLEGKSMDEFDGLEGTMSTKEAADFIAISTRTFERKVKEGLINPIATNMKKNRFSKQAVVDFYINYRGCKPTRMP